ncbi:MAG: polysulfide reductase, partial [Actinomycetota bacterium]|nr:polysulfide reductase [Actinomycetota bacterium]
MREPRVVPDVEPTSYYGRPILKAPVWKQPDVPLYLYLGGVAGVSAVLAEGAAATGRPALQRVSRV